MKLKRILAAILATTISSTSVSIPSFAQTPDNNAPPIYQSTEGQSEGDTYYEEDGYYEEEIINSSEEETTTSDEETSTSEGETTSSEGETSTSSEEEPSFGEPVENVADYNYTTLEDGTVEITGYTGSDTVIRIPAEIEGKAVTSIGRYALEYSWDIESITVPDSVTTINEYAFNGDSLKTINLGSGVKTLAERFLQNDDELLSIHVSENNPYYKDVNGVLFDKSGETLIVFPKGKMGEYTIPDGVKVIGKDAFNSSKLTSITMPDGVITIGEEAFYNSSITSITISDTVTEICTYAFAFCENLTEIIIPDSVKTIGDEAFHFCESAEKLYIGSSVETIGNTAFRYCNKLTTVTIPDSVKSIGDNAFEDCASLTTFNIGSGLETIGEDVFAYSSLISSFTVSENNLYFKGTSKN